MHAHFVQVLGNLFALDEQLHARTETLRVMYHAIADEEIRQQRGTHFSKHKNLSLISIGKNANRSRVELRILDPLVKNSQDIVENFHIFVIGGKSGIVDRNDFPFVQHEVAHSHRELQTPVNKKHVFFYRCDQSE